MTDSRSLSVYEGFYKSSDEGTLGGVCAGLAHKWNMNVFGLRLIFLIFAFSSGVGLLVYIAMCIALKSLPTKNVSHIKMRILK